MLNEMHRKSHENENFDIRKKIMLRYVPQTGSE